MKILFITPYVPHPHAGHGGGMILFQTVSRLAGRHHVEVISFADDDEMRLNLDPSWKFRMTLVPRARRVPRQLHRIVSLAIVRLLQLFRSLLLGIPAYAGKFYDPRMNRLVQHKTGTEPFDIVQIEYTQMGQYVDAIRSGVVVLREHDVFLQTAVRRFETARSLLRKFASFVQLGLWKRYEPRLIKRFDHVITLTQKDKELLDKATGNSVRITGLMPGTDVPDSVVKYGSREPKTILFVGSLDHGPNLDAAEFLCSDVFPIVAQAIPESRLDIIGRYPPSSLAARKSDSIRILDFVEDLESHLQRAAIFAAPIRFGGGIKVKILQALAFGLPVITTPIGAEGIEGLTDENFVLAESAEEFAHRIVFFLQHPKKAESIGRNARELARKRYSWDASVAKLEALYSELAPSRGKN